MRRVPIVEAGAAVVPGTQEVLCQELFAFNGCLGAGLTCGFRAARSGQRMSVQGRKGEYAAFGCSRSARISCRLMEATRELPLSPPLALSAACAKVKFQGRPVARREIGHGQQ